MSELINWSENLNYEAYVKDWYYLSTSETSKNFVPKNVKDELYDFYKNWGVDKLIEANMNKSKSSKNSKSKMIFFQLVVLK